MTRLGVFSTLAALGPANLARVAAYRLGLRSGLHPVLRLHADVPEPPYYGPPRTPVSAHAVARTQWLDTAEYFGAHDIPAKWTPDWHANPFRPGARVDSTRHWSRIPDFDPKIGDIKALWEASRFDWLIAMAQRSVAGNATELARLNDWLADWLHENPPYLGANWKCGQEASIRVMHMALAALLLGQADDSAPALLRVVRLHLARIAPTIDYAIGQQNNHGTSEAAALFIGGSWLDRSGDALAARWMRTGRHWLEERARALIEPDGTFSQYSVNYHRLVLDTFSLAEYWRRSFGLPEFGAETTAQLVRATEWLRQLTDRDSGDAPNLGGNDGARLAMLVDADYRDHRPSVQLAAVLFTGRRAYELAGSWDQPLAWLGLELPARALPGLRSTSFDAGGLHVLRCGHATAYLRYPRFRFRPSQADALHLDLWIEGANVLRDAGTFSYNASQADIAYFNGTAAHCTVEFDGRDQMPRLGRFLFGAWLTARDVVQVGEDSGAVTAAAGYRDKWGSSHHRQAWLSEGLLRCRDTLEGRADKAVLRWRLMPGTWQLSRQSVSNGAIRLSVEADRPVTRVTLTDGAESRYYLQKSTLPVLEVEVPVPATLNTEVRF
jgi:hypothetical protein